MRGSILSYRTCVWFLHACAGGNSGSEIVLVMRHALLGRCTLLLAVTCGGPSDGTKGLRWTRKTGQVAKRDSRP